MAAEHAPNDELHVTHPQAAGYLAVDYEIALQQVRGHDAGHIYSKIDDNRGFLGKTLDWVYPCTQSTITDQTKQSEVLARLGLEASYKIFEQGEWVGMIRLHSRQDQVAQMGYWLEQDQQGKGIVSRAAAGLRDYGFSQWGLDTIQIHIKPRNRASRRVAVRLGATLVGTTMNARSGHRRKYEIWSVSKDD